MNDWWTYAMAASTVRRALASAMIVGPILIAINHADAILHGDLSGGRILKMLLTFAVPYVVSTFSTVQTQVGNRRANAGTLPAPSHSPPSRVG